MKQTNTNSTLLGIFYALALIAILWLGAMVFLGCYYLTGGSLWMTAVFTLVVISALIATVWGLPVIRQKGYSGGIHFLVIMLFLSLFVGSLVPHNHYWRIMENRETIQSMFIHSIDESQAIFTEYDAYADQRLSQFTRTLVATDIKGKNETEITRTRANYRHILAVQLRPAELETLEKEVDAFVKKVHEPHLMMRNPLLIGNINAVMRTIDLYWAGTLEHYSEPILAAETSTGKQVKPFDAKNALAFSFSQLKVLRDICDASNFNFFIQAGMLSYYRIGANVLLLLLLLMPYFVARKEEEEEESSSSSTSSSLDLGSTLETPVAAPAEAPATVEIPIVPPIIEPIEIPTIETPVVAPTIEPLSSPIVDIPLPSEQPVVEPTAPAEEEKSVIEEEIAPVEAVEPIAEPIVEPIVEPVIEPVAIHEIPIVPEVPAVEPIVTPEVPVVEEPIAPETVDPEQLPQQKVALTDEEKSAKLKAMRARLQQKKQQTETAPATEAAPEIIPETPIVPPTIEPIEIPTIEPIEIPTIEPLAGIEIPTIEPITPKVAPTIPTVDASGKPLSKKEQEKIAKRRAALANILGPDYLDMEYQS